MEQAVVIIVTHCTFQNPCYKKRYSSYILLLFELTYSYSISVWILLLGVFNFASSVDVLTANTCMAIVYSIYGILPSIAHLLLHSSIFSSNKGPEASWVKIISISIQVSVFVLMWMLLVWFKGIYSLPSWRNCNGCDTLECNNF